LISSAKTNSSGKSSIRNPTLEKTHKFCFHCGECCLTDDIIFEGKNFCCTGCKSVYQILNENGLASYYTLNDHAGVQQRLQKHTGKYAFLDDFEIAETLISYREAGQAHVYFTIPTIHCSSCIYLLENLHRINPGILRTDIKFAEKEARIIFDENVISLRQVVETLNRIGYDPHLSMKGSPSPKKPNRSLVYKIGIAGFAFGNIMLLSFPEYFSSTVSQEIYLGHIFRYLNVILAIPVFFYCANIFFISAWKGLREKYLNIDFPVALAILVTFIRSLMDVFSNTGNGYFDSMTGIVFFMLAGRILQDKSYLQLSFERDYTDYFPLAATVLSNEGIETSTLVNKIKCGDILRLQNGEIIPVDGILLNRDALIDYSFVTGESVAVEIKKGDKIYAGGKLLGGIMEIQVIKEVAQSYLTGLWGVQESELKKTTHVSFVHKLARNFTLIVGGIAFTAGIYWWYHDVGKIWPAVTAVLIIACPCGLLLTSTFANGFILRLLGKNGLYLRNASIIEKFSKINTLVFDKTGTLTSPEDIQVTYQGDELPGLEKKLIASLAKQTLHTFSKPLLDFLQVHETEKVANFKEYPGLGIMGEVENHQVTLGTNIFMKYESNISNTKGTMIHVEIDGIKRGTFILQQTLRPQLIEMFEALKKNTQISLLSGDEPYQPELFSKAMGEDADIRFRQSAGDKLSYIKHLQTVGKVVAMAGDGLNDAVALKQSDIGICITDNTQRFTPAGDAILEGDRLFLLPLFIKLCKDTKLIIQICFGFSLLYNFIGIYFAVQGKLSALVAAILMPCSTLTIIFLTFILSNLIAKNMRLRNFLSGKV